MVHADPPRRRGRPRAYDAEQALARATDAFWRAGFASTSLDDLSAATGMNRPSLYGAFGDKHGLFLRTLDDYIGSALDGVRAQLRDPAYSAYDRLTRHIRTQAREIAADKSRRGCMMAKSAAELSATDEAVERAVGHAYATWLTELVDCIKEAQRDGTIDKKQNPQALATTVLAFMRGQEALHKAGVKSAQLKASAEQMIALIPTGRK